MFNKTGSELSRDVCMFVLPCTKAWGVSPWWSRICTAHSSVCRSSWSTGSGSPGAQNANFLCSGKGWWADTPRHLHSDRSCTNKTKSASCSFSLSRSFISITLSHLHTSSSSSVYACCVAPFWLVGIVHLQGDGTDISGSPEPPSSYAFLIGSSSSLPLLLLPRSFPFLWLAAWLGPPRSSRFDNFLWALVLGALHSGGWFSFCPLSELTDMSLMAPRSSWGCACVCRLLLRLRRAFWRLQERASLQRCSSSEEESECVCVCLCNRECLDLSTHSVAHPTVPVLSRRRWTRRLTCRFAVGAESGAGFMGMTGVWSEPSISRLAWPLELHNTHTQTYKNKRDEEDTTEREMIDE